MLQFGDRREAGKELARKLANFARDDVVVLALPRGGVPVGYEVAVALAAPLDVFLVRKLGVPEEPELAMGAIASGGVRVVNRDLVTRLNIPRADIEAVTVREKAELERREKAYRGTRPALRVTGQTVLVVDDGAATGASMKAAVQALRSQDPARLIVGVPVASRQAVDSLREVADEVVYVWAPRKLWGVGAHYEDFSQVTDEEVRDLLQKAQAYAGGER